MPLLTTTTTTVMSVAGFAHPRRNGHASPRFDRLVCCAIVAKDKEKTATTNQPKHGTRDGAVVKAIRPLFSGTEFKLLLDSRGLGSLSLLSLFGPLCAHLLASLTSNMRFPRHICMQDVVVTVRYCVLSRVLGGSYCLCVAVHAYWTRPAQASPKCLFAERGGLL